MKNEEVFDRTYLPPADFEFVVLTDTHYMMDPGQNEVEFESRRLQSARIDTCLSLIKSLDPDFVVHLGDLTQHYPEAEGFERSIDEASRQIKKYNMVCHHVAGNHDIGDKPDPTMPTNCFTSETLSLYHNLFGRSWYSWDRGNVHCVCLNSQIMNSDLPEAREQIDWLEGDLEAHHSKMILMFMHLPLYLDHENEPSLGHYDNIGLPARRWLLDLIAKHDVKLVISGHSHYPFFDQIGSTSYFVATSPSFTRPGFGELFSSCPPQERGRNDVGKLGFYLVRIYGKDIRVHFIRTWGETGSGHENKGERQLISRLSAEIPVSPLGLSLLHPISSHADVPITFPSAIRQRVRNDLPLLSCTELGVRHLRFPFSDLQDEFQKSRLAILSEAGVSLTATWMWNEGADFLTQASQVKDLIQGIEIQIPGSRWPDKGCLDQIERCRAVTQHPVTLSVLIPNERVPGKQHNRLRFGFLAHELRELNHHLIESKASVDRVLCRVDPEASPWDYLLTQKLSLSEYTNIGAVDWIFEFKTIEEDELSLRTAEALFALASLAGSRLFLEPLMDFDRTMDITCGLLDRLCNPRKLFNIVRSLNTVLLCDQEVFRSMDAFFLDGVRVMALESPSRKFWLMTPAPFRKKPETFDLSKIEDFSNEFTRIDFVDLEKGTLSDLSSKMRSGADTVRSIGGPMLLVLRKAL